MMQVIQQTDEEKMAMYMKLPKKEIIAMLIQCNKILDSRMVVNENFVQPAVIGSLPCHHNFIQKDTYWKSCTHCGMLAPLGQ
jgi:hypothetical protein